MDQKQKLESRIAGINQFQFLCFLPGIIFAVTKQKPIDAVHAHNAAIFRSCTIVVGLLIFAVLQFVKFAAKKRLRGLEQNAETISAAPIPPPF